MDKEKYNKQRFKYIILFILLIPLFDLFLEQLNPFTSFYHPSFLGGLGFIADPAILFIIPYAIALFYTAYKLGRKIIIYIILFLLIIALTSYSGLKYSNYQSRIKLGEIELEKAVNDQAFANDIKLTVVSTEKIPDQYSMYWVTIKTTINKAYADKENTSFNIFFNDNDQLYLYNTGFSFDLLKKELVSEIKKPHEILKIEKNSEGDTEIVMVLAIEYNSGQNEPMLDVSYLLKAPEKDENNNQAYKEYKATKSINIINAIALSE